MSHKNGKFVKCPICNKERYFSLYQLNHNFRFCSKKCADINLLGKPSWNKEKPWSEAHKKKLSKIHTGKVLSEQWKINIGNSVRGEKSGTWKGGRIVVEGGYIYLKMPEHPLCGAGGYIREHRYMAECILGRFLDPKEVVHHIDGNKHNNLLENLYLFPNNGTHLKNKARQITKSNLS